MKNEKKNILGMKVWTKKRLKNMKSSKNCQKKKKKTKNKKQENILKM